MRTFWLSFASSAGFLGVAVVEVTDAEIQHASRDVAVNFPKARPGAGPLAAAARKAWRTGCNPGGEIQMSEVDPADVAHVPKHVLLSKEELLAFKIPVMKH